MFNSCNLIKGGVSEWFHVWWTIIKYTNIKYSLPFTTMKVNEVIIMWTMNSNATINILWYTNSYCKVFDLQLRAINRRIPKNQYVPVNLAPSSCNHGNGPVRGYKTNQQYDASPKFIIQSWPCSQFTQNCAYIAGITSEQGHFNNSMYIIIIATVCWSISHVQPPGNRMSSATHSSCSP